MQARCTWPIQIEKPCTAASAFHARWYTDEHEKSAAKGTAWEALHLYVLALRRSRPLSIPGPHRYLLHFAYADKIMRYRWCRSK